MIVENLGERRRRGSPGETCIGNGLLRGKEGSSDSKAGWMLVHVLRIEKVLFPWYIKGHNDDE